MKRQRTIPAQHALPEADRVGNYCYGRACINSRAARSLFCAECWAMITPTLQRSIVRKYGRFLKSPTETGIKVMLHDAINAARLSIENSLTDKARARRQELIEG